MISNRYAGRMNCPKCDGQVLTANKVGDLEVDHCNECGGLWLDKSELGQLVEAEASEVKHLLRGRDQTNANARRGNCPHCKKEPLRVTSAMKKQVTVDSCPDCGSVWLDGGEFNAIFEK